jgi:hypothetical protein
LAGVRTGSPVDLAEFLDDFLGVRQLLAFVVSELTPGTNAGRDHQIDVHFILQSYDGAYWHRYKEEVDRAKSRDILAGGYRLVRLREHPLPGLCIDDPHYTEVVVYATSPAPEAVMARIKDVAAGAQRRDPVRVVSAQFGQAR